MVFQICMLQQTEDGWVERYDEGGKVPFTHKGNI